MTYNQFITQVKPLLFLDAENPETTVQGLIDQSIRAWAMEMQGLIQTYRAGNVNTLASTDFTTECKASKGNLPIGCDLSEITIIKPGLDEDCPHIYYPKYYSWERRKGLIEGTVDCHSVSIDPQMVEFYVFPVIEDGTPVKIYWEGMKNDYSNDDEVPFGADAIACCADYVNSRIASIRDDKTQRSRDFQQRYEQSKRRVYLNEERRSSMRQVGRR